MIKPDFTKTMKGKIQTQMPQNAHHQYECQMKLENYEFHTYYFSLLYKYLVKSSFSKKNLVILWSFLKHRITKINKLCFIDNYNMWA